MFSIQQKFRFQITEIRCAQWSLYKPQAIQLSCVTSKLKFKTNEKVIETFLILMKKITFLPALRCFPVVLLVHLVDVLLTKKWPPGKMGKRTGEAECQEPIMLSQLLPFKDMPALPTREDECREQIPLTHDSFFNLF